MLEAEEASDEGAGKDEIEAQMKEMQAVCDPIIASIYNSQGYQGGNDDGDEEFEDL